MTVMPFGGRGLADNKPVGGGHVLVVGHVEQVVHGAPVHSSEQRQQVRGGPAARLRRSFTWPVLVLTQARTGHGDRGSVGTQPGMGSVGADLLRRLRLRPAVSLPPRGPGPQPVTSRELHGDLPVAHPQRAHLLPQDALLGPQAGLRMRHVHSAFLAEKGAPRAIGTTINGSRHGD